MSYLLDQEGPPSGNTWELVPGGGLCIRPSVATEECLQPTTSSGGTRLGNPFALPASPVESLGLRRISLFQGHVRTYIMTKVFAGGPCVVYSKYKTFWIPQHANLFKLQAHGVMAAMQNEMTSRPCSVIVFTRRDLGNLAPVTYISRSPYSHRIKLKVCV